LLRHRGESRSRAARVPRHAALPCDLPHDEDRPDWGAPRANDLPGPRRHRSDERPRATRPLRLGPGPPLRAARAQRPRAAPQEGVHGRPRGRPTPGPRTRAVMSPYSWTADPDAVAAVPALALAYAVALRLYPTRPWRVLC